MASDRTAAERGKRPSVARVWLMAIRPPTLTAAQRGKAGTPRHGHDHGFSGGQRLGKGYAHDRRVRRVGVAKLQPPVADAHGFQALVGVVRVAQFLELKPRPSLLARPDAARSKRVEVSTLPVVG